MRILITQRELIHRGGSEMFTIEVAAELRRRGHEVAVYCPRFGDLAKFILAAGVWVKARLREIPWLPEMIHGQHHLPTMTALTHFEVTPAIYHCHGFKPWVEKPPLHPRIRYYVMMSAGMAPRAEAEYGVPRHRTIVIENFVNLHRFSRVRDSAKRPRKALVFGNDQLPVEERFRLETACAQEGLTLDFIGTGYGNPQPRPEIFLLEYDLVFAVGKCAIEALACGCAVIPLQAGQAGNLITPHNFLKWAGSNFCPPYYSNSAAQINPRWLQDELRAFTAEGVAAASSRLRAEYNLGRTVDKLEAVYQIAGRENVSGSGGTEKRDLVSYLEARGLEIDGMYLNISQVGILRERVQELEHANRLLRLKNQALRLSLVRPARRILGLFRSFRRFTNPSKLTPSLDEMAPPDGAKNRPAKD